MNITKSRFLVQYRLENLCSYSRYRDKLQMARIIEDDKIDKKKISKYSRAIDIYFPVNRNNLREREIS